MFPKVSIILPVYNAEQYVEKCINSILSQSFQEFELIIIDDGSSDRSGKICDDYAIKDHRVTVTHTKNRGPSYARNKGLGQSKGQYIGFVDSDDWIQKCMLERLYDSCITEQSDFAVAGIREVNERGECLSTYIPSRLNLQSILKRAYPCNKLFRRELFFENNLFFAEGRYYEDLELIPKLFLMSERQTIVSDIVYNYVKRKNSTTSSRDDRILDNLWAYTKIKQFLLEKNLYSVYQEDFNKGVSYFKRYYINILYDYPTLFFLINSRQFVKDFTKIGGFGVSNYFILMLKHLNYQLRRLGHFYKQKFLTQ